MLWNSIDLTLSTSTHKHHPKATTACSNSLDCLVRNDKNQKWLWLWQLHNCNIQRLPWRGHVEDKVGRSRGTRKRLTFPYSKFRKMKGTRKNKNWHSFDFPHFLLTLKSKACTTRRFHVNCRPTWSIRWWRLIRRRATLTMYVWHPAMIVRGGGISHVRIGRDRVVGRLRSIHWSRLMIVMVDGWWWTIGHRRSWLGYMLVSGLPCVACRLIGLLTSCVVCSGLTEIHSPLELTRLEVVWRRCLVAPRSVRVITSRHDDWAMKICQSPDPIHPKKLSSCPKNFRYRTPQLIRELRDMYQIQGQQLRPLQLGRNAVSSWRTNYNNEMRVVFLLLDASCIDCLTHATCLVGVFKVCWKRRGGDPYASKSEGKTVEISCRSPNDRSARAIFWHAHC